MIDDKDWTDIIIEGNQASWEINGIGAINGSYLGTFKFRCYLTPTLRLAAGKLHRELLGENPSMATESDDNLAFALAQLKYRVISAPPFWTASLQTTGFAGDIPDQEIIMSVLEAAIAAELKYKKHLETKKKEAIERARKAAEKLLKNQQEETTNEEEN